MAAPPSTEKPFHPCANCQKDATKNCSACREAPDANGGQVEATWYCGLDCQQAHWGNHKIVCKALQQRKILYRAGETAQLLFYTYREIVFDKLIVKVERKGNEISLYEGEYEDDCFIPFPAALFPDEREKQAVLTYLACGDALGYLHEVLKIMLKDISSQLLEIAVDAWDYQSLKVRLFELSGAEDIKQYQHEALKVGLKNGNTYIMDLAGAQYGHHASVVPTDTYFQTRAGSVLACQSFGHQQRLMKEACGAGGWKGAIRSCNEGFHQGMNASIDDWQDENISLSAMLKLPEKQFLPKLRQLVTFVDKYLRDYKQWREKGGHLKMRQVAV